MTMRRRDPMTYSEIGGASGGAPTLLASTPTPVAAPRHLGSGLGWAAASAASFATAGPFAKSLIGSGWSPGAAVTARVGFAALLMLVPALLVLRGRWSLLRRHALLIVAFGAMAVAGAQLFYFIAVTTLSVGVALLIEYLSPVLIVGYLWARGDRPGPLTVVGVAAAVFGLALVVDAFGGVSVDPRGVAWALGATCCSAAFFLLSARDTGELPSFVFVTAGMVVGAVLLLGLGLLGLMPLEWATGEVAFLGGTVSPLVPVAGLVVLSAIVPYSTGVLAVRGLGSKVASFVALTEVIFAVLFAWAILGELPRPVQLAGGAFILLGAVAVKAAEGGVGLPRRRRR